MDDFDNFELYEDIIEQRERDDEFILELVSDDDGDVNPDFDANQDLDLYEDIIDQQERDDDCILEPVSDDDRDANPDFEEWFDAEENPTEFTPECINFEKETFETFHKRPNRGGGERQVSFIRNPKNVVGTEIESITEEIANSPSKLYSLVYNDTFYTILNATNSAVDLHNEGCDVTKHIQRFQSQEIQSYFGIKILFMLEKGRHVRFQDFYTKRLRKAPYNIFWSLPNGKMDNLQIPSWERYNQLVKYIDQCGFVEDVDKKTFKASVAKKYQPQGGYFIPVKGKDGKPYQCVNLDKKIRPIQEQFNRRSILFMKPDKNLGISIDEIIKKAVTPRMPLLMYLPGKTNKYGIKGYLLNDNLTTYLYRIQLQFPSQFSKPEERGVVNITMTMVQDFFQTGINLTCDRWYTTIELVLKLFDKQITYLGTVSANRINRYLSIIGGAEGVTKLKKKFTGQGFKRLITVFAAKIQKSVTHLLHIVFYRDKKTKESTLFVTTDSTMFNDRSTEQKQNKKIVNIMHCNDLKSNERPGIVDWYNKTMGAVDRYDQHMHDYTICTRYGQNRWPIRIIELFRDLEFQNIFILWKQHSTNKYGYNVRTKFYYQLAFEFLTPMQTVTEVSTNRLKRKNTPTKLAPKPKKMRKDRRKCTPCSLLGSDQSKRIRTTISCYVCDFGICREKHQVIVCHQCLPKKK